MNGARTDANYTPRRIIRVEKARDDSAQLMRLQPSKCGDQLAAATWRYFGPREQLVEARGAALFHGAHRGSEHRAGGGIVECRLAQAPSFVARDRHAVEMREEAVVKRDEVA